MKRNRVTVELVLDIPATKKVEKYIKLSLSESVTKRQLKVTNVEELPDEVLGPELRHGERMAVKKILDEVLVKLKLDKYFYFGVTSFYDDGYQPVDQAYDVTFQPSYRFSKKYGYVDVPEFNCSIGKDGLITVYTSTGRKSKVIGTIADQELKDFSVEVNNRFGKWRKR